MRVASSGTSRRGAKAADALIKPPAVYTCACPSNVRRTRKGSRPPFVLSEPITWARYPFHRRFFPPAPLVVARAERDRLRCLVGVSAEVGRASYEQSSVVRK